MTDQSTTASHNRRAIDEKALAEKAPDVVQAIAHDQPSKLRAQKSPDPYTAPRPQETALNVMAHDQPSKLRAQKYLDPYTAPRPQETALDVMAVDGNVAVSGATGRVTRLTPNAARLTSDRLLATARDAAREGPTPSFVKPNAKRDDGSQRATDDKKAHGDPIPTADDAAAERAR